MLKRFLISSQIIVAPPERLSAPGPDHGGRRPDPGLEQVGPHLAREQEEGGEGAEEDDHGGEEQVVVAEHVGLGGDLVRGRRGGLLGVPAQQPLVLQLGQHAGLFHLGEVVVEYAQQLRVLKSTIRLSFNLNILFDFGDF